MRTQKPISTISFNSPDFLYLKLHEFYKSKVISFFAFIIHEPEPDEILDEAGKKEHIHVYIEPSKMMDTDKFRDEFKEFDPLKPDKPKGVLKFQSSKFADWCFYGLHDRRYLAMKGQSRHHHYSFDMFFSSDADDLLFMYRSIDMLSLSPYQDLIDAQNHGLTWVEYFRRGTVPLQQLSSFERAWYLLSSEKTERNKKPNHAKEYKEDEN